MTVAAPEPKQNMGRPEPRLDATAKVTGSARYASDFAVPNPAYAYLVTSAISRGTITSIDDSAAASIPGVLLVMTSDNTQVPGELAFFGKGGAASTSLKPLESKRVWHDGDIIGMIVAESFEAAREAAYKLKVSYQTEDPTASFSDPGTELVLATKADPKFQDPRVGDIDKGVADAAVMIEADYSTPTQHHNAMELFGTTCQWVGNQLTVYEPSQWVVGLQHGVAKQLNIDAGQVHVLSPYIGGAFGGKGGVTQRTVLVAMAARQLGRPVKLVVSRDQGFTTATYRAETRHRIRLGASKDGKLTAYSHEGWEISSRPDNYKVGGTKDTAAMYGFPNIHTQVTIVKADRNTPGFMRSPPETPYMYALETAMDELAVKLGMDPVELRRINDTKVNPVTGAAYTSRSLVECYEQAARAFGWEKRSAQPSSMRDGDWLIGWGCATATYPTQMSPAAVRVRLGQDGEILVQVAAQDVGSGAYTVIGQEAARWLGQPMIRSRCSLATAASRRDRSPAARSLRPASAPR